MNRIGDLSFLIAVFLIFNTFGTLEFVGVFSQAAGMAMGDTTLLLVPLLLFVAATGKSAQLPLFTWLPDALARPTPVSALIHVATLVFAGLYMFVLATLRFSLSPIHLTGVTLVV